MLHQKKPKRSEIAVFESTVLSFSLIETHGLTSYSVKVVEVLCLETSNIDIPEKER